MTQSPETVFALVLLGFVGWLSLPLIPAFVELLYPKDAAPLNAVGNDAGNLTFFAESFTTRATREGLLGTMVPPRLSDGSPVRTHSQGQPLPVQRKAFSEFIVLMDSEPVPDGVEFSNECLARLTVRSGANVTYRALLGQRDILLGTKSTVLRWVHARGRLEVAGGSRLLGRATAERAIVLEPNVIFERMEAGVIRVSGLEAIEAPVLPTGAYERFVPPYGKQVGPAYWRIDGGLPISSGSAFLGSAIATGAIVVNDGARVTGSLKAHEEVIIRSGAVVTGSIASRKRITIERGAKVSGPIISEESIVVEAAVVGSSTTPTTITAPIIRLLPGATIYGAVMAREDGLSIS